MCRYPFYIFDGEETTKKLSYTAHRKAFAKGYQEAHITTKKKTHACRTTAAADLRRMG